jgi:hypothetical protein
MSMLLNPYWFGAAGADLDPYFGQVVLLLGANGADGSTAFVDESSYGRTLTPVNNARMSTSQFKFGVSSAFFDGTNDAVTTADHASLTIGSSNFTIEAWIRPAVIGVLQQIAGQRAQSGIDSDNGWSFLILTGGTLEFAFWDTGGTQRGFASSATVAANTWTHVAVDRDATGKFRVYVNGTMSGSATFTGADGTIRDVNTPFRIGLNGASQFDFNGHIDEVRFTVGAARYASDSGFSVPTAAFPRS